MSTSKWFLRSKNDQFLVKSFHKTKMAIKLKLKFGTNYVKILIVFGHFVSLYKFLCTKCQAEDQFYPKKSKITSFRVWERDGKPNFSSEDNENQAKTSFVGLTDTHCFDLKLMGAIFCILYISQVHLDIRNLRASCYVTFVWIYHIFCSFHQ